MLRNFIPALVLAAALSACTMQPELLNSERIEKRFGSYGIEILEQDRGLRFSKLYSTHDGVDICRTYAVVEFVDMSALDAVDLHDKVVAGASIGATFRADGWDIRKQTTYVGEIVLDTSGQAIADLMHIDAQQMLATHVYELYVDKAANSLHYATIVEVHHPDYLDVQQLLDLFPVEPTGIEVTSEHVRQLVLQQPGD